MNETGVDISVAADEQLGKIVDEFLERQQRGEAPDPEEYVEHYPELAHLLKKVLPTLRLLQQGTNGSDDESRLEFGESESEEPLGDYRIVRELGRGGMGVVYEATQLSLGRSVALKVLPFAATMDPRHLQRFKNEAIAAACLDHPHIVDVYGVGCERGVHFYAMRLIEGHTLAEVIAQLCQLNQQNYPIPDSISDAFVGSQPEVEEGEFSSHQMAKDYRPGEVPNISPEKKQPDETCPERQAAIATKQSTFTEVYFRSIAELTMHVAEALNHAHQQGIIHRDVKPSNVMVDGRGKVWVTDFGLAHVDSTGNLTLTGDMVGTLRYMSPEQASAKRVPLDHRTDVYSLGTTLYELLTLQPAFPGEDRQELLHQISSEDPGSAQRINRSIPLDLSTITMKAMEKNPADRYETAQDLADDLRRYLEDRPIQAKPPSLSQKVRKWTRRHQSLIWSAATVLLLACIMLAGSIGWIVRGESTRKAVTVQVVGEALDDTERFYKEGDCPEALSAATRARGLLAGRKAEPELHVRVDDWLSDLNVVKELEEIRLLTNAGLEAEAAYQQAFRNFGIDVFALEANEAARRMKSRNIASELAVALDNWARLRRDEIKTKDWKHLLAVARLVDTDRWRNELRSFWEQDDRSSMIQLARSVDVNRQPPVSLYLLAVSLRKGDAFQQTEDLLRRAQKVYPNDLWFNLELGYVLSQKKPPQVEASVGFIRAALAVRPRSSIIHNFIGSVLAEHAQKYQEAEQYFRNAIRHNPDNALAHCHLGWVLHSQNRVDEAIAAYQTALSKKDFALVNRNLGLALIDKGEMKQAISRFRHALELKEDFDGWFDLGSALAKDGQYREAIGYLQKATQLRVDDARPHFNLGVAFKATGNVDESIKHFEKVIDLDPTYPLAHYHLGSIFLGRKEIDKAILQYQKAIKVDSENAAAHHNLGVAYYRTHEPDKAVTHFIKTLTIDREHPHASQNLARAYFLLGNQLFGEGKLKEAEDAFRSLITIRNQSPADYCNLGVVLLKQGKRSEAIEFLRQATKFQPPPAEAFFNLGNALVGQSQVREAISAYRNALQIKPRLGPACNALAWQLANCSDPQLRNPKEAVMLGQQAVKLVPQKGAYHRTLGVAYYRAGDWKGAKKNLEQSMTLHNGGDSYEWFFLAMSDWQMGNKEEARQWYERAATWIAKNAPNDEELRRFHTEAAGLLGIAVQKKEKNR